MRISFDLEIDLWPWSREPEGEEEEGAEPDAERAPGGHFALDSATERDWTAPLEPEQHIGFRAQEPL